VGFEYLAHRGWQIQVWIAGMSLPEKCSWNTQFHAKVIALQKQFVQVREHVCEEAMK